MPTYEFVGEQRTVFSGLRRADGRTLECDPGERVDLDEPVKHPLLVAVADPAAKSGKGKTASDAPTVPATTD